MNSQKYLKIILCRKLHKILKYRHLLCYIIKKLNVDFRRLSISDKIKIWKTATLNPKNRSEVLLNNDVKKTNPKKSVEFFGSV